MLAAVLLLPGAGACAAPPPPEPLPPARAEIFAPGVISDGGWQYRITFTPDGGTAYFTVADGFFPRSRRATIHRSQRQRDGSWSAPEVAPFSGAHTDIDPFITPDGRRLYFSSIRPENGAERADLDLFVMERTAAGWGPPVRLGPEVNSAQDELYASLDAAGNLYFASGPFGPSPGSAWNIYSAAPAGGGFAARIPLDAVNTRLPWDPAAPTRDWEFNPEVSADGRMLIFASLRPGGHGFGDLYVSHRGAGGWGAPVNLGPVVNTGHDEFHPTLSRDGRTLYFARTVIGEETVPSSFYFVATASVEALRPR
jgi:hypothetical protein